MEKGIPVRAVCRSIAALQAINRHGSLSLMEIAKMIDLPYPTACRIIQTLIYEGLIECEPTRKRYRATALVQSLSAGFHSEGNMLVLARPHIVALTKKVSWPVSIATHVGQWMIVRDSTHSLSSLTFNNYDPGYTFPILESACGHAYLAYASEEERQCVLNGIVEMEGRSLTLSMFESGKLVERIREDGYATHDRNRISQTPGKTSSMSVPLFDSGRLVAILTLTFFSSSMTMAEALKRYMPDLKAVAMEISDTVTADSQMPRAIPAPAERARRSKSAIAEIDAQMLH